MSPDTRAEELDNHLGARITSARTASDPFLAPSPSAQDQPEHLRPPNPRLVWQATLEEVLIEKDRRSCPRRWLRARERTPAARAILA